MKIRLLIDASICTVILLFTYTLELKEASPITYNLELSDKSILRLNVPVGPVKPVNPVAPVFAAIPAGPV